MSKRQELDQLAKELEKRAKDELHSVVWIALPCTAWCSWQALNMARGLRSTVQLIDGERRASMRLLKMLTRLLRRVLKKSNGYVHVCYEWPKNKFGWKLEIVQELRKLLPFEATFDGCSYGLVD
eukprot:6551401-Heterocapsa_arctica.AAC.1